jgi:hypothetical protein
MMEIAQLVQWGLIVVTGVLGYFLRMIHTDVRNNTESLGKLKEKLN